MNEWKDVILIEVTDKIGDGLHGTPKYDAAGDYFFINGNNLNEGKIIVKEETKKIAKAEFEKYQKPLSNNTILLGINGTIGNLAFYKGEKCVLGKSACYINVNEKVDKHFLFYNFLNRDFQKFLEGIATGTTLLNVPLKGLREYTFSLPPLLEQKSIAEILSSLDDKIDLLHRQNKTLEQLTETLFRQWFVEDAEDNWEVGTIDDVVSMKGGTTPSTSEPKFWDGNIHWTSPRDLSNTDSIFLFDTSRKITDEGLRQISSGLLPVGTLLLSSRAPIGYLALTEIPVAINQGYIAIICNKIVSNYYMFLWCKANMGTIENAGNGSVFQEISKSAFRTLEFQIPPRQKLKQFDKEVKPLFEKIKSNTLQIHTLTEMRDILLPKLMSGEITIKTA